MVSGRAVQYRVSLYPPVFRLFLRRRRLLRVQGAHNPGPQTGGRGFPSGGDVLHIRAVSHAFPDIGRICDHLSRDEQKTGNEFLHEPGLFLWHLYLCLSDAAADGLSCFRARTCGGSTSCSPFRPRSCSRPSPGISSRSRPWPSSAARRAWRVRSRCRRFPDRPIAGPRHDLHHLFVAGAKVLEIPHHPG